MNTTPAVQILNNEIHYSRGTSKFDNAPEQRTATNFDDFEAAVLADRAVQKGLAFVCSPLASGIHYQKPDKYPGETHWRLANYALPRTFLPFDLDGFASVEAFQALLKYLERYRGFGYTTARATPEAPRARAILLASRPVTRKEGKVIGKKLQSKILAALGAGSIKFDDTVYRGEQPVYTPVVTSETFHFSGSAVDVDALLSSQPNILHGGGVKKVITPEYLASLPSVFVIPDRINDGEGREDFVLRYAAHLRGKGLDQSTIERILLDYNAAHIAPPLDDEAVLDRARRYETADPIHAANDTDWPAPEEINATLPPVPAFDPRLLPPVFRNWVGDIADRMQCPVEFLAVGAMVAAGAVVGNRIGVQPKRLDIGWVEVPNLWGAVVGRPGVMKSPALAQVLCPLKRLEANALAAFSATRTQYEIC